MTSTASTFSVTGGLAAEYIARGQMIPWSGVLVTTGSQTGDRRRIEDGALSHRDMPLPFMVQLTNPVNGGGHDGATLSGRIDTLELMGDGQRWWGTGYIDPTTVDGDSLALALDRKLMRGVSVDLDQVEMVDIETDVGKQQVITHARIIGATACPFQAFAEAEITLDLDKMVALAASAGADFAAWEAEFDGRRAQVWSPIDAIETLIASAATAIPVDPPAEWFVKRKFTELTPLTVTGNGQVFGHIAAAGTCHISFGRCVPVPKSKTNYAAFRCGSVVTAEGTTVRTGPIVMDTVHPDLRWQASDAMSFYADTGATVCDVVPYDDKFGMAVVGAMRPQVDPARLRAFRGSDMSPDWRTINGVPQECCAILAVNNSGFKLPQTLAASAGAFIEAGDTAVALDMYDEVYAIVASGPMSTEPCCDECAAHNHDLVASGSRDNDPEVLAARRAAIVARFIRPAPRREFRLPTPCPPPRTFRVAGAQFTSEGARKSWVTRKANGWTPKNPDQPPGDSPGNPSGPGPLNGLPGPDQLAKMTKTGGPLGSQGGGWYRDTNGQRYLVKPGQSKRHAHNELAAHLLYKHLGVPTDETGVFERDGKQFVVKKAIQNPDGSLGQIVGDGNMTADLQQQARQGFGVDALASSWDAFGLVGDNVLVQGGTLHRIDVGGALAFRAMGGDKQSFNPGEPWVEPDTLRKSNQGKQLYGNMSNVDAADQLDKLRSFNPDTFDKVLATAGVDDTVRTRTIATLRDRVQVQLPKIVKRLRG